ncbi:VWA domain-containing protein [Paenibacillus sp. MBLB4367]|uniref:VWA domain-containing protein n=1 Tax=Paenibacillus sp. MBLB4367 TaxID=3384767 RepID=UPI0039080FB3
MGIRFNEPWVLLLLAPLCGFAFWLWLRTDRLSGMRKTIAVTLRTLILLILILALAGIQSVTSTTGQTVVFVADRSDSMPAPDAYEKWMQEAGAAKKPQDRIGVVSSGLEAVVERQTDDRDLRQFQFTGSVNRAFSNIASGLQLATGMTEEGGIVDRIVLLSDGMENVGDMARQARLLRDKGVPVDVLPIPAKTKRDAAVESVKVPEKLYQAEKYSIEVAIRSSAAGEGELRIYEDNREVTLQRVALEQGLNRFVVQSVAKDAGLHRYRAELYMEGDEQAANNAGYAFSRVNGPPKVLVVEGDQGSSKNVTGALDAGLMPYELIPPELLPKELADYAAYESIVLNDVSGARMSQVQMQMIEQAVRDYGIGLVMLGGENSFGLGGYFQTPVEKALPVYMDLRGKREIPSLAIMLVIDKSGSMSGGKMELAQEAATRTVDLLRDKDTLGVLAFDGSPWWVVEPQKLTDKKKAVDGINAIRADGGTEVYGAVKEAYEKLTKVSAQRKHIILLTDGQSSSGGSYEALAADMVKDNISLSSVAIGQDADQALLERIALLAKGRYYFTDDQSTVPAIFSREAVLISRTYIVDQPFVPAFAQGEDWSSLFAGGVPAIGGYIATTAKETAESVLISPEPDPLLARWQYGAGKSAAWTSDVTGKWSGEWITWSGFPDMLSRVIKWTFPQFQASPVELSSELSENTVTLRAKTADTDFQGELRAVVTDDSLGKQEALFTPIAPGEYEAKLPVVKPGVYVTKIDLYGPSSGTEADGSSGGTSANANAGPDGAKLLGSVTSGIVVPYSPEYRLSPVDGSEKLRKLAELTGGRLLSLDRPGDVFAADFKPRTRPHELSRPLLIAALLLWLADVAVRRLSLGWARAAQLLRRPLALLMPALRAGHEQRGPAAEAAYARLRQRVRRASPLLRREDAPPGGPDAAAPRAQPRDAAAAAPGGQERPAAASQAGVTPGGQAPPGGSAAKPAQAGPGEAGTDGMSRLLAAKNRKRR